MEAIGKKLGVFWHFSEVKFLENLKKKNSQYGGAFDYYGNKLLHLISGFNFFQKLIGKTKKRQFRDQGAEYFHLDYFLSMSFHY